MAATNKNTIKSCSVENWRAGKIERLTRSKAKLIKISEADLEIMDAEDKAIDEEFKGAKYLWRGPVVGRPKKGIKREVAAIRIPADALKKIKALGRGWSTRAGDALAELAHKGLL